MTTRKKSDCFEQTRSGETEQMTQHSTFDDNGAHYLSSPAVIDHLMHAARIMAVRSFVLSVYALSLAIKPHDPIRSLELSESAAPRLTQDLGEAHSDDLAGNPR